MNKAFEKILFKIEEHFDSTENRDMRLSYHHAMEIVKEVAEEYNNVWIPCSERLPEEPEEGLTDLDECDEYIAMIENADIPTALNYAGNGEWYRDGEFYKVIAWQPLPEPYKETIERTGEIQ